MNALSLSSPHEMSSVFAQRTLMIALVLGLHAGVAGMMMRLSSISASDYVPAHAEARTISVSLVQMQQAIAAPKKSAPLANIKPHVEPVKRPQKMARSGPVLPPSKPAIAQQTLTATSNVASTSVPVAPSPSPASAKEEPSAAPVAPSAPKSMPLIAAHVDANYSEKTSPPYPAISRRLHEEGKVQLMVDISPKGEVQSITVKQSSGFPRLDDVALNTVRSWRFVPARRGDVAVADSVVVPVLFKLND